MLELLHVGLRLFESLLGSFQATLVHLLFLLALCLALGKLGLLSTLLLHRLEVVAHLFHLTIGSLLLTLHLRFEANTLKLFNLTHANSQGSLHVLLLLSFALFLKNLRLGKSLLLFSQEFSKFSLSLLGGLHILLLGFSALLQL